MALTVVLWLSPAVWLKREVFGLPVGWLLALEIGFAAVGIAAAALAFGAGWRVHGRLGPGLLFGAGAALLAAGVFGPLHYVRYWGTATVLSAGALLVAGHLWNLRLSRAACAGPSQAADDPSVEHSGAGSERGSVAAGD
jgi:hypothetical protein